MAQSQIQLLPVLAMSLHCSCPGEWSHIPQEPWAGSWIPAVSAAHCRVALQMFGPGTGQPHWQNHWSQLRWLWALSPACDAERGQDSVPAWEWGPHSHSWMPEGESRRQSRLKGGGLFPSFPCFIYLTLCPSPSPVHSTPSATAPLFFGFFWLCVWGALIFLCINHMILFPQMDVGEDSWLQDGDKAGRSRISHQGCLYCPLHLNCDWIQLCFGGAQIILWIKSCTSDARLNGSFWFKSVNGWFKKFKQTSLGVYLPLKLCYWNICSVGL